MQDGEWIKFAASDSVSELVWSQRDGLSVKSVDCRKSDKKPIILWNIWQTTVPLSPSRSVGSSKTDDKQISESNFIIPCANSYVDGKVIQRDFPSYNDTAKENIGPSHIRSAVFLTENSPKMDEENSNGGDLPSQKGLIDENLGGFEEKEVCSAVNFVVAGMADETQGTTVAGHSDQIISLQGKEETKFDIAMTGKLDIGTSSNANTNVCNNSDGGRHNIEAASQVEEQRKETKKTKKLSSLNTLEFSAENDLQLIDRNNSLPSEERILRGNSVPVETSSIIKKSRWKGQKKAVSDGNLEGRFVDARDESQQSKESCNSVGFLSKGKRKCEFQDNLMAESKRIKKQIHGISASTSMHRHDSSFMNWIINVAKGSSLKANQEGAHSLQLELGHPNHEHGSSSLQKPKPHNKRHNSMEKSIGFQNVFKSMYTSSAKFTEARPAATDGSEELGFNDKVNLINSPELFTAERCGDLNKVIPLSRTDSSANNLEANLEENKVMCISNRCEGIGSKNPIPAGEVVGNKSTLISSLWITRLSTPIVSSSMRLDRGKISNFGVAKYPCDSTTIHTLPQLNCSTKANCNRKTMGDSSYQELPLIASKDETCNAIEEIYGHNHQNPVLDQNCSTLPAENSRKSEATAFMFPRKLDALKRLVPSGSKDLGTCFFCGKRRESFSCCSHLNEAEQVCSQPYDYSYDGAEEVTNHVLPVTSIRCIQSSHLAVSCQVGGSSGQKLLEKNVCQCAGQNIKKDKNDCFVEKLDHPDQVVHYHSSKTFVEGDCEDHLAYGKELLASGSPDSTGTEKQQMKLDKKSLIFHQFLPVTFNDPQVVDLPKEIFNAVRRLQVSRADMLKLMNSQILLSHIEGFFLRLRLGKWEAGLGGTGYHVACITGKSIEDGQNCLYVDVGGIKCPVGSQYVSNQEFSEEELKTWWCRSMRSGGMIPSKDDLELKFNQRIKLGF